MTGVALELTHNHGTENDPNFSVWNGNTGRDAGEPGSANYAEEPAARGFGHIAFNCDDVYAATEKLLANGIKFQKKPDEGRMKGLAFALECAAAHPDACASAPAQRARLPAAVPTATGSSSCGATRYLAPGPPTSTTSLRRCCASRTGPRASPFIATCSA